MQTNAAPVANAGSAQSVTMGSTVTLDGSGSSDANGDTLTYAWGLTSKPGNSSATLSSATVQAPTLTVDVAGTYTITLVVNDGQADSVSSSVSITASYASTGYVKLDADGLPLPDSATSWSCVRDNATQLAWEVKNTADSSNLRYYRNGYTHYDDTTSAQVWTGSSYASPTQAQIDASTNSVGYKNDVNAQGLCGATDWRLPTLSELKGLMKGPMSGSSDYVDTSYFPDVVQECTNAGSYWSSTPDASNSYLAWIIVFNGDYYSAPRYQTLAVRLVRSVQ